MRSRTLLLPDHLLRTPVAVALLVILLAAGAGGAAVAAPYLTPLALLAACATLCVLPSLPKLGGLVNLALRLRWWQALWLALYLSGLTLRVRTSDAAVDAPVDAAAAVRIALVALTGFGVLLAMAFGKVDLLAAMSRGFFLPLLFFNLANIASTAWSVNPGWTLYKSIEHTIDTMLIAVIVSHLRTTDEYKRLFDWTWLLSGLVLLSVGFGAIWAPDRALSHGTGALGVSIEGVIPVVSRNGVGGLSALLSVVAIARIATGSANRRLYACLLGISATMLIISQTRSALLPVVLAVPFVLIATRRTRWLVPFGIVVVAMVAMGGLRDPIEAYVLRESQFTQQNATLSGRLYYWSFAWEQFEERPLTGYGAYAGGRFLVGQAFDETLSSAHGAFPEILIGTSIWGVLPIFALLVGVWVFLLRRVWTFARRGAGLGLEQALAIEATAALIVVTVRAFFTVELIWHPSLTFLAIVGYAEYLRRQGRLATETAAAIPAAKTSYRTEASGRAGARPAGP
ncbi:MAG: O-antigen ligase family protein [Thermomicrobiales bacterium]